MLPLLLVLSPLVQLAEAAPTNITSESPAYDATSCSYRSVWSIVATCALTMLVCVWNATYPNIVPAERWYTVALHRGVLGLVALLAPEITTARAVAEWRYAGHIKKDFRDDQWTRTHGFFALMGGFAVQDGPQRKILKTRRDLCYLKNGTIVQPMITKEEISDRSKSDGLGNALLILQLSWFILQVVARASNHLATTLLEIDTLALAVLSLPLFYFWWSKPMAAAYPHIFYLRDIPEPETSSSLDGDGQTLAPLLKVHAIIVSPKRYWWQEILGVALDVKHDDDGLYFALALLIVWIVFGALHLIAWDFQFPSHAEKIMWRVASLVLIAAPCVCFLAQQIDDKYLDADATTSIGACVLVLGVVARLTLLILMLVSLRDLSASAYQTVSWTSYVPHL
ncbi:hypothetical protein PAXINDRAFT_101330 [Paxillus involutus ATCC 200175]|uniref:Uncharacterized protein n=1 Tax=Paxillus involutus ATCC 200175 TaxID=664439 RepID=A0A0C9T9A9_PAXIN|nr:hypothetical protein PAXINDRAFT_101330 [Paxillus involutus ATCC 200175]